MSLPLADRIIGKRILHYAMTTSTNDVARRLVSEHVDEGTVIVAGEQTLGRGSRGREWLSPARANLLVSVILRTRLEMRRISEMAFVASLGVANYLIDDVGLQARVKWPNDVRVGGKKIAGILIEAVSGDPPYAIVGVGININWADIPPELAETATSVLIETGRQTNLGKALEGFLCSLETAYRKHAENGFGAVLEEWKSLDCIIGSEVETSFDGETVRGVAEAFGADGSLLVRLPDGSLRSVSSAGLVV
jgi:BirA family transcriptional regulator, biotin operon repressor / biotin---[acetyl-CoA-carboxylase] ligase